MKKSSTKKNTDKIAGSSDKRSDKRSADQKFYDKEKLLMELIPITLAIIIFIVAFYTYPKLPNNVPIHWNASGDIDNYGPKLIAVFLIPIIYLIFIVLSFILPAMDVFKENIKSFYKYYFAIKVLFGIFFLTIYIATLLPNFGYNIDVAYITIGCVIILFFILGYILRHVKRNFFIGIRTPWTISSDAVWDKTHEVGGVLFMIVSVILLIGMAVLKMEYLFYLFITLIVLITLYLIFYSYYLYRKEITGK